MSGLRRSQSLIGRKTANARETTHVTATMPLVLSLLRDARNPVSVAAKGKLSRTVRTTHQSKIVCPTSAPILAATFSATGTAFPPGMRVRGVRDE